MWRLAGVPGGDTRPCHTHTQEHTGQAECWWWLTLRDARLAGLQHRMACVQVWQQEGGLALDGDLVG